MFRFLFILLSFKNLQNINLHNFELKLPIDKLNDYQAYPNQHEFCFYPFKEFLTTHDQFLFNQCLQKSKLLKHNDSSSLEEAIRFYTDRYKMSPPKRFGEWFNFAKKRGCRIDLYDQMINQIVPFRGQNDLSVLIKELGSLFPASGQISTFSLFNDKLKISNPDWDRAAAYKNIFNTFQKYLPDVNFVINTHAQPIVLNKKLVQKNKDMLNESPSRLLYSKKTGYIKEMSSRPEKVLPYLDVLKSNCLDSKYFESLRQGYGLFLSSPLEQQTSKSYPVFSWGAYPDCSQDILIPSPYHYNYGHLGKSAYIDTKEYQNKIDRVVWYGATSGSPFISNDGFQYSPDHVCFSNCDHDQFQITSNDKDLVRRIWFWSHRQRLMAYGKEFSQLLNIRNVASVEMHPDYIQQSNNLYGVYPKIPFKEFFDYKIVIDIDGNGYSSRFLKLLRGNSLIFGAHYSQDWFSDILIPFYHYIPIDMSFEAVSITSENEKYANSKETWPKVPYSYSDNYNSPFEYNDLGIKASYFLGNDEIASKIAQNGKKFAETRLRVEDMDCYIYRAIIELFHDK
eukprot:NODE_30_length_37342_cov_0.449507.p6 type:complete len:565 gc:universal NODE_30_length_37342_cov_0.449507:9184-10878(+)